MPDAFEVVELEFVAHTRTPSRPHDPSLLHHICHKEQDRQASQYHVHQAKVLPEEKYLGGSDLANNVKIWNTLFGEGARWETNP